MADLTIYINEKITLDGTERGVLTTQTISGINNVDNRIMSIPSGSQICIFSFNSNIIGQGSFSTGSFKYSRVTNKSDIPLKLTVEYNDGGASVFTIDSYSSFYLSSTQGTGSFMEQGNFTYNDFINQIYIEPSGSSSTVEYFIATT